MADTKFWTGLFAGAAVGFVAYKMIGGAKRGMDQLATRRASALPAPAAFNPNGVNGGHFAQQRPYPQSLHGIPTVPLPAASMAHTRMARPTPPPPPPAGGNSNGTGGAPRESFGGDMGTSGMGGESF
jgi:hypothetical protein